jgi:hypothetical protein
MNYSKSLTDFAPIVPHVRHRTKAKPLSRNTFGFLVKVKDKDERLSRLSASAWLRPFAPLRGPARPRISP